MTQLIIGESPPCPKCGAPPIEPVDELRNVSWKCGSWQSTERSCHTVSCLLRVAEAEVERLTAEVSRLTKLLATWTRGDVQAEVERLQRDYGEFEELSPPDSTVPRKEFVSWCFRAWEQKCEREQREAAEAAGGAT